MSPKDAAAASRSQPSRPSDEPTVHVPAPPALGFGQLEIARSFCGSSVSNQGWKGNRNLLRTSGSKRSLSSGTSQSRSRRLPGCLGAAPPAGSQGANVRHLTSGSLSQAEGHRQCSAIAHSWFAHERLLSKPGDPIGPGRGSALVLGVDDRSCRPGRCSGAEAKRPVPQSARSTSAGAKAPLGKR